MTTDSPVWTPARHPLARLIREMAAGTFPVADGGWMRVSPWSQDVQGILQFTGHAVLAVSYDHNDAELTDLGVDGQGGALHARVVSTLAGERGWIGPVQTVYLSAGRGTTEGDGPLVSRPDLVRDPFVEVRRRTGTDLQVLGTADPGSSDLVVLGHGIAGLREVSVQVTPDQRGRGRGAELLAAALDAVPEHEVVVATVPVGNVAAMRAVSAAGFTAAGAVQLFSNRPERR